MEKLEQDLNALVRFIGTSDRGRRKGRVENVLISHRMQDPVHTTRKRLEILNGDIQRDEKERTGGILGGQPHALHLTAGVIGDICLTNRFPFKSEICRLIRYWRE
jgi:hypothetical protein